MCHGVCVEITQVRCLAYARVVVSCLIDLHTSGKCAVSLPQHW